MRCQYPVVELFCLFYAWVQARILCFYLIVSLSLITVFKFSTEFIEVQSPLLIIISLTFY